MLVKLVRTPTDFEATMGFQDYVLQKWINPPADVEPEVRKTIDEIFEDLQHIGTDDPGLTAAFVDGLFEPLQRLRQFGLQLVSVVTSGTLTIPADTLNGDAETSMPWRRTIYVVAPEPCYYRLPEESPANVHKLGVECAGLVAVTMLRNSAVATYGSCEAVEQDYEGSVPWCETCELYALVDP